MFVFPSLLLCLAPVLSIWARRRALAAPPAARAWAWFWCIRFLRYLNLGTVALWWFFTDLFHSNSYAGFVWESYGLGALPMSETIFRLVFWSPPIVVLVYCHVLFQPVYARVRGFDWNRAEIVRQALYGFGVWLVPVLCLVGAFEGIATDDGFPAFVLRVVLGIGCLVASSRCLRKRFFLAPYALTTGELRDRAFALAAKLGVKLRQIYLVPPGKTPLANAFARSGNSILLTETLLSHLNKREVDAVIAHELAHLKHDHPRLLGYALMGGFALIAVPYYFVTWPPEVRPYFDLLFVSVPLFGFYFFSRRFEYTADATAVRLTGDPAASISGLVRLHQRNVLPLEWSRWSEKGLTHPSTVRRARRIGRDCGIADARVSELLAAGDPETAVKDTSDFYTWPKPSNASARIFSTEFKQRTAVRLSLLYLAFAAIFPALLLGSLGVLGWQASGFLAFLLALIGCVGLALLLSNFLPFAGNAGLCRRLRARFAAEGIPTTRPQGILVGFSPGPAPRIFESNYTWDAGSLVFTNDRLCFFGEQIQFALRRDQIVSVGPGDGPPGWFRNRFLYLSAQMEGASAPLVFNLRPIETNSALGLKRSLVDLERRVSEWHTGAVTFAALPASGSLGAPQIGEVTSTAPAEAWQPRQALATFLFVATLSGCAAYLFGLPADWLIPVLRPDPSQTSAEGISGWYAILTTAIVLLVLFGPLWFARPAAKRTFAPPPPVPTNAP